MTDRPADTRVLPPATCPLCHTIGPAISSGVVDGGSLWTCARCGQRWSGQRIATVEAYLRFADTRLAPPAWRRSAGVDAGTP